MCGVFGAVGSSIDTKLLMSAAGEASKRGPHAFGFSWLSGNEIQTYKGTGPLSDSLDTLARTNGARWIVGSSRMATFGSWRENKNNQPLTVPGVSIVHNGNVYNASEILFSLGWTPKTESDTEAILALAVSGTEIRQVWNRIIPQVASVIVIAKYQNVSVFRHMHPVFGLTVDKTSYFGSRPFHHECSMLNNGIPIIYEVN